MWVAARPPILILNPKFKFCSVRRELSDLILFVTVLNETVPYTHIHTSEKKQWGAKTVQFHYYDENKREQIASMIGLIFQKDFKKVCPGNPFFSTSLKNCNHCKNNTIPMGKDNVTVEEWLGLQACPPLFGSL